MPLSLIGYPGSKSKLVEQIFATPVPNSESLVYVEPFFGGGSVYLNLPQTFASYRCSDILSLSVNFFKLDLTAEQLDAAEQKLMAKYNLDDKDQYYAFRAQWNERVRTHPNDPWVALGFVLLANHCINNLVRFGPDGFNQGWGGAKRGYVGLAKWQDYVGRRRPNSQFFQADFRSTPVGAKYFWYIDPPYSDSDSSVGLYSQGWSHTDDNDLLARLHRHVAEGGLFILSSLLEAEGQPGYLASHLSQYAQREITKTYKASAGQHARKDYIEGIITNLEERSCPT